jgi:hypothetical protein
MTDNLKDARSKKNYKEPCWDDLTVGLWCQRRPVATESSVQSRSLVTNHRCLRCGVTANNPAIQPSVTADECYSNSLVSKPSARAFSLTVRWARSS